jgi:uncharacterized protein
MSIVSDVLHNNRVFAVVGVSQNKEKYGCEVFETLLAKGYEAYPVNPEYKEIDGRGCYPSIEALPERPEVVVTVVPPEVTAQVVDSSVRMGVNTMWMPPGSWTEALVDRCEAEGIELIHDICLVSALRSVN